MLGGSRFALPRVHRITPDHVPWSGETDIVIEGANFVSGGSAKLGGEWITAKSVTPEKIVGVTRRYRRGTFDVMVRHGIALSAPGALRSP